MPNLFKQLKPYRWIILIILLFQMGRAYTTLLLPQYTSKLIDTGIQNSGFQYGVPLEISAEGMKTLDKLLLPDEKEIISQNYLEKDNGNYQLKPEIADNRDQMLTIESKLIEPLALEYFMLNGSDMMGSKEENNPNNQQGASMAMMKSLPAEVVRPLAKSKMEQLSPQMLKNAAIGWVKEEYANTGNSLSDFQISYLLREGGFMILIALASVLVSVGAHFFSAKVGAGIGYDLRQKTFSQVLNFSQVEINNFSTASLITRGTNDIQQIQTSLTILLRFTLFAPILAIGGIYQVIKTGTQMTWIIVLSILIVVAVVGGLLYVTMPKFKRLQEQVDKLNLFAREILTGLQVIRAFGRQSTESERFDQANQDLMGTQLFVNRVMSMMMPLMMLVMNATSILIIWVAGFQIADGTLQVGQMTAFIAYTMQIIFAFLIFSMVAVMLPRAMVSADRVQEIIDTDITIKDPEDAKIIDYPQGRIEFDKVSFAFKDANQNSLDQVSFTAEPGQTTAIVGSTGAGKSTILNLLLRFYDVTQGRILVDGVDIRDLKQEDLRDIIGYVPQKGVLFSGTIETNIKYSDPQIDDQLMITSADIAHATEFISEKKEGYQSKISQGGSNVSGGQKQRLSIARAIAKEPIVYLFDDSFSALDYRTDIALRTALNKTTHDKTVMIIAQRISTILNADKIIVLDEGKVVGMGTHQELLESSEVYYQIASSQLSPEELEKSKTVKTLIEGGDLNVTDK